MIDNNKQVAWGAIFSYITIFANALYGFVIAPYILTHVGESDYGVYQTIAAISSSIMVIDVGLGGTVMKYMASYKAQNNTSKIGALLKVVLAFSGGIAVIVVVIAFILYMGFESIYGSSFNGQELGLGKQMLLLSVVNMLFVLFDDIFVGIISGLNKHIIANGIRLLKILLRYLLLLLLIPIVRSSILILILNILLTIIFMLLEFVVCIPSFRYIRTKTKIEFSFVWEIIKYTFFMFSMAIINQFNSSFGNVIVGARLGTLSVTIYSFALTIFAAYEHLSTAISKVMLPSVANAIYQDDKDGKVQSLVVGVGRIQFMLLGAAVGGFAILGKDFIALWLGGGRYLDVYILTMILIVPSTLELCVNVMLSVLRVLDKLAFRTVALLGTSLLNLIISFIGIKYIGYYAVAIGTAVSITIGSLIIMNIYYYRKLGFNMILIYKQIFKGILPSLLVPTLVVFLLNLFMKKSLLLFIVKIGVFISIYVCCLFFFGFNKKEKNKIYSLLRIIH